jgi:peroxiredoxin
MSSYVALTPGDPAPWFVQRAYGNPRYAFDTVGGRYVVLCFFGSAGDPHTQAALRAAYSRPAFFDDDTACFFGVTHDARDETRLADQYPGYRYFWDADGAVGRLYGSVPREQEAAGLAIRRMWIVLDPACTRGGAAGNPVSCARSAARRWRSTTTATSGAATTSSRIPS